MEIDSLNAPAVLQGRLALVTGAGQGNGRAIARGLARAGARVVVTDLNPDTAERVAGEIREQGGTAWSFQLDVASHEACTALAARVGAEVGQVDLLVNNAGIIIREGMDSPNVVSNFSRMLDVNLHGTFLPVVAWLPALRATRGCIVNIGSTAGTAGLGGAVGYSPSKGAVRMLTQALAAELAKDGVRVNAVAPGVIDTPMTVYTRETPGRLDMFLSRTPMRRVGQPEELVGPVVFLASAMATYVTGVTLPVDGGYLAA